VLHRLMLRDYQKALISGINDQIVYCEKKLTLLQQARALSFLPGSTKLFFKNLFLRFSNLS
jgi:hypothetical protein